MYVRTRMVRVSVDFGKRRDIVMGFGVMAWVVDEMWLNFGLKRVSEWWSCWVPHTFCVCLNGDNSVTIFDIFMLVVHVLLV